MRSGTRSTHLLQTFSEKAVTSLEEKEFRLIDRVLEGNFNEFEYFVDTYELMIRNLAQKNLHSENDVEDFTQEVFLKAFSSLSMFRKESKFSTWIYQIARNQIQEWNSKSKKVETEDPKELENSYTVFEDQVQEISKKQKHSKLHEIIQNLPSVYKKPITLHYFNGMSYQEIAKTLGCKLNTVKSNVFRGKDLIRKWWKENEF